MIREEEPSGPEKGRVIANRYLLERELGHGGMGSVWVAKHLTLDIYQAIKFIRSGKAEASRDRFHKEAALLARLHGSDHVVQIRDYGDDHGLPYIVMDLLEGQTLQERLKSWSSLTIKETNFILQQIVSGLELAHGQKIIHRDLKPANIFLARSRQGGREVVKILDFGIAKLIESDAEAANATRGIGSVAYMSPEHFITGEVVDARSDLWSLGILLFELLTGRLPYSSSDVFRVLAQLAQRKGPPLRATDVAPHLPPEIDRFFAIAFMIEKKQRFQSAGEMGRLFEQIADAERATNDTSEFDLTRPRHSQSAESFSMALRQEAAASLDNAADTTTTRPVIPPRSMQSAGSSLRTADTQEQVPSSHAHSHSVAPVGVDSQPGFEPLLDDGDTAATRLFIPTYSVESALAPPVASGGPGGLAGPYAGQPPASAPISEMDRRQSLMTAEGTIVMPVFSEEKRPLALGTMPLSTGGSRISAGGTLRLESPSERDPSPLTQRSNPGHERAVARSSAGPFYARRGNLIVIIVVACCLIAVFFGLHQFIFAP